MPPRLVTKHIGCIKAHLAVHPPLHTVIHDKGHCVMTKLAKGSDAPDFELLTDKGETFRLSDHRGKRVLLYFYPQADTPACNDQNTRFSNALETFEKAGVMPVGISPDPVEKLAKFRSNHGLKQTLLADPDHRAIGAYGVWGEKLNYGRTYMGLIRTTVLVGSDGKIEQIWPNIRAKGHVDRMIKALC